MAMGMSYDEFWDGDVWAAKAYREADEIRQERRNEEAWLHGLYIYQAILDAAPILSMRYSAKKPAPYLDKPLALTKKERQERAEKKAEKKMSKEDAQIVAFLDAWAIGFNKKFLEKKEGADDGIHDPGGD